LQHAPTGLFMLPYGPLSELSAQKLRKKTKANSIKKVDKMFLV